MGRKVRTLNFMKNPNFIHKIAPPGAGLANDVIVIVDGSRGVGTGLFSYNAPSIIPEPLVMDTVGGMLDINGAFFGPFFVGSAVDCILFPPLSCLMVVFC
jgi:hypothetical protein